MERSRASSARNEENTKSLSKSKSDRKLKTIRISYNIGRGDLETKVRQAREHLERGCRVKLEMRLRGRENEHAGLALILMKGTVASLTTPTTVIERPPTQSGRSIEAQLVMTQSALAMKSS